MRTNKMLCENIMNHIVEAPCVRIVVASINLQINRER